MSLREKLTKLKGDKSVTECLQSFRSITDELSLIDSHIHEDDLIIHVLNRVGSDFKKICDGTRARETIINFEEFIDKLVEYESFLQNQIVKT